ncbi:MAG TPA: glycosyltransferase family 39 protein, partial [Verrucomicrobiae bacterium]|nr:glycosyltransferase family 39 protein [Verrucomicrobiae bacterium]
MNLNLNFQINTGSLTKLKEKLSFMSAEKWVVTISIVLAFSATAYYFATDAIVAYGDAESHLNIAKRVVHSLTPGFAQLGGIWLPLPHILLLPLVYFNSLWRSGLAGSIISGIAFVISSLYIYKLTFHISKNKVGSIFAALVFMLNLNILYLQATPMTELPLIVFFILSTYYFVRFLDDESRIINLLLAAFFGFCATLSRYDGWFLVGVEAVILFLKYLPMSWKNLSWRNVFTGKIFNFRSWGKAEGMLILFGTLAFFGIVLWLTWDFLILGDPLYFTHSQFSAKSQQQGWLGKGQLPAYQNLPLSLLYYAVTMMSTLGLVVFTVAFIGFFVYLFKQPQVGKFFVGGLLVSTFFFYVITLYLGQSIIFIPHLTPPNFEATLFNVRYGVMMVPFAAVFFGYFVSRIRT